MNTIVLQIADEAIDSFISYLSGYVVELETVDNGAARAPAVVVVAGNKCTGDGLLAIGVLAYDQDQLKATGELLTVAFERIRSITVF